MMIGPSRPLPSVLRCRVVASVLLAAAAPLRAQDVQPTLQRSPAELCLAPALSERGRPDYPQHLITRKDGGVVSIELVFTAPDRPPGMRLLDNSVNSELVDSVREHVQVLRVPCMQAGAEPVRLTQKFVFVPNDGRTVMASLPVDAAAPRRAAAIACLTRIVAGVRPGYPQSAIQRDMQGNFYVRMRFDSPTAPPQVEFIAAAEHAPLRSDIEKFAEGFRLPCMGSEPAEFRVLFNYRIAGGDRTVLRDSTLVRFLGNARSLPLPAFFDFNSMGCPFDLRLTYMAPHGHNQVREIETSRPERRALIDWLATITLKLDDQTNTALLGDSMTLSVPCGKLDLKAPATQPASESTKKE